MLTLDSAIEKIKQLPPEQQQEVFNFIESIDLKHQPEKPVSPSQIPEKPEQEDFFTVAGIWEKREINIESIRQQAWREKT
jgi:hypothetical protein